VADEASMSRASELIPSMDVNLGKGWRVIRSYKRAIPIQMTLAGGVMPIKREQISLLKKAAKTVGGIEAFATRVGISAQVMRLYLEGRRPIPNDLVLKAVDVVLDGPSPPASKHCR
jgi:hypothetical protein